MVMSLRNTDEKKKGQNIRIKEIRLFFGLTQKQFAESLGMSREGYQKLERGVNNLSLDVLERMKRIYGVSSDYLLFGDSKDTETMWGIVQGCSENTKLEIVVRLIEYFTMSRSISFSEGQFKLDKFMEEIMKRGE